MADNTTYQTSTLATPPSGLVVAGDDVGGALHQRVKVVWGADGTVNDADTASGKPLPVQLRGSAGGDVVKLEDGGSGDQDPGIPILAVQKATPANTAGTDGDYEFLQVSAGKLWTHNVGDFVTVTTDVTRPANTTTYTINDAMADTTPTAGGFTFTNAARVSGGSGIITDMMVSFEEDAATPLQGELVLFNTSVTAVTDNATFAISDAEAKTVVAIIPFTLTDFGNQGIAHVQNLAIGFTCSGSANLRFLIRVKNGYVPTTNSSVITFTLKIIQTN